MEQLQRKFSIIQIEIQKQNEEINEHVFIFAYDGSKFYGDMEYVEQFEDAEYNLITNWITED